MIYVIWCQGNIIVTCDNKSCLFQICQMSWTHLKMLSLIKHSTPYKLLLNHAKVNLLINHLIWTSSQDTNKCFWDIFKDSLKNFQWSTFRPTKRKNTHTKKQQKERIVNRNTSLMSSIYLATQQASFCKDSMFWGKVLLPLIHILFLVLSYLQIFFNKYC